MIRLSGLRQAQRGFSLLEILVAFSIMALSIGMLLSIFSSGLRNAVVSEDYTAAVQIAEALIAGPGVETPLQSGHTSGTVEGKYRWDLDVAPFNLTDGSIDPRTIPIQLYSVTATVGWGGPSGGERQFELSELKMASGANEKPQ